MKTAQWIFFSPITNFWRGRNKFLKVNLSRPGIYDSEQFSGTPKLVTWYAIAETHPSFAVRDEHGLKMCSCMLFISLTTRTRANMSYEILVW